MNTENRLETIQRNGNLHIRLHGRFTPETAEELTRAMAETYPGQGNIFIHTAGLDSVEPEAREAFDRGLGMAQLPRDRVYLTGRKGLEIGWDRGKVIVYEKKKTGCCGRCRGHNAPVRVDFQ